MINVLDFVDLTISVATTQLCCCSVKEATDNTPVNECGCVPIKLYLQEQVVGQIWPLVVCCPLLSLQHGKDPDSLSLLLSPQQPQEEGMISSILQMGRLRPGRLDIHDHTGSV